MKVGRLALGLKSIFRLVGAVHFHVDLGGLEGDALETSGMSRADKYFRYPLWF